jgi:GT2 family glycosyltransferase
VTARLDLVIVTHNTRDDVLAAITSVFAHPPGGLGRVLVVDNASTDGTAEAIGRVWPHVEVIALDHNRGFAAANNVGLRAATAPLVLLLNSDTLVPAGAIEVLVERLMWTGAVAAGPRLDGPDGAPEVSFGRMLSPLAEAVQAIRVRLARRHTGLGRRYIDRLLRRERDVDWVSGACLLVRREAALAAGLFDERYFLYEEDVDFCAALRARGGRIVFTPAARVIHLGGRSTTGVPTIRTLHYDRSHLAFYEKHRPGWVPLLRLWLRIRRRPIR